MIVGIGLATALVVIYGVATLILTYVAHQYPRRPVNDRPDWGTVESRRIQTVDGRELEVWRVLPDGPSRGVVLLAHGWSRNRDRMVQRARIFGQMGFTTVMHSARDHGRSSPCKWMSAAKFAEDIQAVMQWIGQPVILYGHSAGAAGAAIAAARQANSICLLFLEGCYPRSREALLRLYYWIHPLFGLLFGRAILFWMEIIYHGRVRQTDPARQADGLRMPVMLIHGEHDRRFPLSFARRLQAHFKPGQATLFVGRGAGHSNSSQSPGYDAAVRKFVETHWRPGTNGRPPDDRC